MRIAIDAMGGDYAPHEVVKGALNGAREQGVELLLVGQPQVIEGQLTSLDTNGVALSIVEAPEVIAMEEHPSQAVRAKKGASIVVATELVKEGAADALVTMGHTGAAMIAALFILERIEGIQRPAVGAPYLGIQEETFIIDGGANVDCKSEYLLQFGLMGSIYVQKVWGIPEPTVALLSNGAEDTKGNQATLEAFSLLKRSGLNFIGNIEGMDIPYGRANVVVADGLLGNVVLKLTEGLTEVLLERVEKELAPLLSKGAVESTLCRTLEAMRQRHHYSQIGGMPLLGVNGVVVIGHGRSKANSVVTAIGQAKRAVEGNLVEAIREGWEKLTAKEN